ncbi:MAG: ethanolamine utilization protein [Betaproteobacteria bacterium HGW-Betaproteobacteria-10]|nr:MAG: ethanolamine utilization protein [Betaproteobacteria bacterium HGW-Betaproteobacteria-10]
MRPLAFVDLETTGATAANDRITEIGIVEVDADGSVREWQQLVNPGVPIPPFIEQLTGISNAMVANAPAFGAVAAEALRRLEGRLFIAHNAKFDYSFLQSEFKRLGITFRPLAMCTVKLSRALFPAYARHNLDSLIERHGLRANARHRALADAQLIHQFWQKIHVDRSIEEIEAALRAQNAYPSLPPQLDRGIVDELPDTPGVYLFYGENNWALHIGKAKDIRQRVLSHFSAKQYSAKEIALAQQIRRIDWIETGGEMGATLKAAALNKELLAGNERQRRKNETMCTWTLIDQGDGWLRPALAQTQTLNMDIRHACYGLFKNSKEATDVLRALATEQALCDTLLGLEKTAPGQPCAGHLIKRCKGACLGHEAIAKHSMRLVGALARLKLVSWPFNGPGLIREGDEAHVINAWRYLGTAKNQAEIHALLENQQPGFDHDTYKILAKYVGKMRPLPALLERLR